MATQRLQSQRSVLSTALNFKKSVVEANRFASGVSGFSEFRSEICTTALKQNEFVNVNGLRNVERTGLNLTDLVLNADRGKISNFIIGIVYKRQAIVFFRGLRNDLKQKLQNVISCVMNAMRRYLVLVKMSFTELNTDINAAVDARNAVPHIRPTLMNGENAVKKIQRVTHVNVSWLLSRTRGRYPLAPPIFSKLENFLRGQIASTDEIVVRSSCREWTPRIKVYQTKKAKNILAKVASFLKSLVPTFELPALNFAFAPMEA